nr:DUF5425 family lipoprotein [Borreliella burgdorferi]
MNRKFVISLLFIILTFLLILGCDLSINNDRNKLDGASHFKKKYMDNLNYQCLSKKESEAKNSQIKLDENNKIKIIFILLEYLMFQITMIELIYLAKKNDCFSLKNKSMLYLQSNFKKF